eukprot:TRINITY_DN27421_c0_g1_i1.p1 TRINITY_DN27421_c0_g1~~TRINITY_DN27421_c0_g1_i1.p1  ORF type:complete len:917 (+),score=150.11 TRINITY_DN27421_c0_g1_i1:131-2881(+)
MCSFLLANFLLLNATWQAANRLQARRGPDATVHRRLGDLEFVHNLLSMTREVVHQPFQRTRFKTASIDPGERGLLAAMFNGEFYNAGAVLGQLAGRGAGDDASYRSDGEVLLPGYERFGAVRLFRRLDGEWAAVIVDWETRRLTLSRDCFGTKPLFLARDTEGRWAVASYRSALAGLGFAGDQIREVPPNVVVSYTFGAGTGGLTELGQSRSVCEFDLRQWKTDTADWRAALASAVAKRADRQRRVFIGASSGYDSGALQLLLHRQSLGPFDAFTVTALEDLAVVRGRHGVAPGAAGGRAVMVQLGLGDVQAETGWLHKNVEPYAYKTKSLRGADVLTDPASFGLSHICRRAKLLSEAGATGAAVGDSRPPVFMSAAGADEVLTDYGHNGTAFAQHSYLAGIWPENLSTVFPWPSFFLGTQRDYLAKEEHVAGAHGLEARYAFLDRRVVQESLWLAAETKMSEYKRPLADLFRDGVTAQGAVEAVRRAAATVEAAVPAGAKPPRQRDAVAFPFQVAKKPFAANAGVLAGDARGETSLPSKVDWLPRPARGATVAEVEPGMQQCTADVAERLQVWVMTDTPTYTDKYYSKYSVCDLADSAERAGFGTVRVIGLEHVLRSDFWEALKSKFPRTFGEGELQIEAERPLLHRYPVLRYLVLLDALERLPGDVPILVVDALDVLLTAGPLAAAAAYCALQPARVRSGAHQKRPQKQAEKVDEHIVLAAEPDCYPFQPDTEVGGAKGKDFYGEGRTFMLGESSDGSGGRPVHAKRICSEFRRLISGRAFVNGGGMMGRVQPVRQLLEGVISWLNRAEGPWAQPVLYLAMLDHAELARRGELEGGARLIVDADARVFASLHTEGDGVHPLAAQLLRAACGCSVAGAAKTVDSLAAFGASGHGGVFAACFRRSRRACVNALCCL